MITTPGTAPDRPTLAEFLLARIDEDASALRGFEDHLTRVLMEVEPDRGYYLMTRDEGVEADTIAVDPWRLNLECQAKREIVQRYLRLERMAQHPDVPADHSLHGEVTAFETVLRELAITYAGHPDYRDEWSIATPLGAHD